MSRSRPDQSEAFTSFYRRNEQRLMAFALRRTDSPAAAEDLFAETMATAWRRFDTVPAEGEFGWLCAIAAYTRRNHVRSAFRARRRVTRVTALTPAGRLTSQLDTDHLLAHQEEAIIASLGRLSAQDQEVLALTAWDGLGSTELAQAFGTSELAARKRLSRARARLRREYDRYCSMEGERDASTP